MPERFTDKEGATIQVGDTVRVTRDVKVLMLTDRGEGILEIATVNALGMDAIPCSAVEIVEPKA